MPNSLLDQLEEFKKSFEAEKRPRLAILLSQLSRRRFEDAASLIRLHESLVFMLAYPQSKELLNKAKAFLASFPQRVDYLKKKGVDLTPFEESEVSGIAGTSLTVILGYKFALWLSTHHPKEAEIDWEGYEEEERIGATLPRVLPLLEEEALVEAHIPFLDYIHSAKSKEAKDLAWLMREFSALDLTEKQKAELYESLKLFIRFAPDFNFSRTGLKREVERVFYHQGPLIQRRDISLKKELGGPALKIKKLSAKEGSGILDTIRNASAVRFRELHGFIWSDEKSFLKCDLGRGVTVYLNEVLPDNRLPLRAYHSGFLLKNGIPVGYVEGLSLFEKMEVGFNLYYTFREGETAWLYAQLLRIFKQHLGITVFSVDPYQIGHENEEGIESGAFWFYRKLGFFPVQDEIAQIIAREEEKIAKRKDYRTPARVLRKIAERQLLYVYRKDGSATRRDISRIQNEWKDFQLRNILLAIQSRMSKRFNGNVSKMCEVSIKQISLLLNIDLNELKPSNKEAFGYFALVLSLIPNLRNWTGDDKNLIVEIIRAKGSGSDARYLYLLQKHKQLRRALIRLGNRVF